jgi:hypothetical protein
MSDAAAIVIGATVSGLVGVLVVALQHALQLKSEAAGIRARRLSEFTAAAWGAFDDLGPTTRASTDSKEARKAELGTREAWDRFNAAFAQVQILETKDVYDAATSVQHEMVRCKRLATETEWILTAGALSESRSSRRCSRSSASPGQRCAPARSTSPPDRR